MFSLSSIHTLLFDPLSYGLPHPLPLPPQHKPAAQRIYQLYVNPDARQPVNLDGTCVEDIQRHLDHPPPDLFNTAQKQVSLLL